MHKMLFGSLVNFAKGFAISLLLVFAFAMPAFSQSQVATGTIQGDISDANGAAVAGATVEIKNLDTSLTKTLTTDEGGRFVVLALPPGKYSITVSKQGFATAVAEKLDLTVGQTLNLPVAMKISSVEERVTINATPTVDTVKTESSTTINDLSVNTTPILGRKFEDLLTLTPGVSVVQGPDGDEITFSGQRGVFNNVSFDGGDYNNGFFGEQLGGQRAAIDIPLDAVKEFQVVATGATAEFGRTAGGIINVISKSGTNDVHGSLFYFQRLEGLTAHTSDGKPLKDFNRKQFGGAVGGPISKNKAFFFFAFEGIREKLSRANLSEAIGTPCSVTTPTITANEALINGSADCQRLALINFIKTTRNQDEGQPVSHKINNQAFLAKVDWDLNSKHKLALSYNFDYSKNTNQTFDVATYGNSANGIEGPSKINNFNVNLFSSLTSNRVNEAHFSYTRELRPRNAIPSSVPADTAMGFATTFRFGNPFFLNPTIDELLWRTDVRDNFSIIHGNHTMKVGGEWLHTLNDQVFRGFFEGRYIFDSVSGFLRYASPAAAGGFGPTVAECFNNTTGAFTGWITQGAPFNQTCAAGSSIFGPANSGLGGPLLLFLQNGIPTGIAGVPPPGKSVLRASYGIFYGRQNMLTQVGSITDNGVQQFGIFCNSTFAFTCFGAATRPPTWPGIQTVPPSGGIPFGASVRVFDKNYANPRIYTLNAQFEQEIVSDLSLYFDFTHSKGVHLTRFLNYNRTGPLMPATPLFPTLGDVFVTSAVGKSLYNGFTVGMRKRMSRRYQFEWNYVLSKDQDDDSNERDPFTDRSLTFLNLSLDYSVSDRDIRHKFNFYSFVQMGWGLEGNFRIQAHGAQPISGNRTPASPARNTLRKDNAYFSFDWRIQRPFKFGEHYALIPIVEMFNTFNSKNNINPLSTPGLFNFDGFLRQGVADPRQDQLAVQFTF